MMSGSSFRKTERVVAAGGRVIFLTTIRYLLENQSQESLAARPLLLLYVITLRQNLKKKEAGGVDC